MQGRRPRVRPLLRALFLLAVVALPTRLRAQQDSAASELLVQLRIAQGPGQVLEVLQRDSVLLVPVRRFLELAEVRVTELAPGRELRGRLEPGGVTFGISTTLAKATRGAAALGLSPGDAVWRDGELYVATPVLAALFDVTFTVDYGELVLLVDHAANLPAVRRLQRERQRRLLLGGDSLLPSATFLPRGRRLADGVLLDWSYTGATRDPVGTSLLQLGLGLQVLRGSLALQYLHQEGVGASNSLVPSWTGAWPTGRWVRQLRLGEFLTTGRTPWLLRGVELTNSPFLRPAVFADERFGGRAPDGWDVDIYHDNRLLAYSSADTAGRYDISLPTRYGLNLVDIVSYGPTGEVRHTRRTYVIPPERLQAHRFEYALRGGACADDQCKDAVLSDVRYGVSNRVTIEGSLRRFGRDTLSDLWHPGALLSAGLTPAVGLTLEGVVHALARLRLDFDPQPDLHLDVEHSRFATGVHEPLLTAVGERRRTDAVLIWRFGGDRSSSLLQIAATQVQRETGSENDQRLAFSRQVASVRLVGGLRRTHVAPVAAGATADDRLAVDLGADGSLGRLHRALGPVYARVGAGIEPDHGISYGTVEVSRQLFGGTRLEVETRWDRLQHGLQLNVGLTLSRDGIQAIHRSQYTAASGLQGVTSLEGSLSYDPHLGRVEFANGRNVGRARVAGRVYRDVNENGRWDAGEGLVPNATLRVGSRGVTTDSSGRYTAWDLIPFEATSVELDTLSLPDPSWVPPTTLFQLAPSPNAYTSLDIPLVPGHELEGRVVAADGRHAVGGVTLLLRYIATGRTRRIVSFGDGSFYLLGLQAGEYEMTVSPTDLRGLQADASPIRFEIGRTGDRTPGVEVRLRPAINAAE